ncbi:hypothetical protein [Desulfosporosinus meridiei]|uniref:Uncharacterized protein n=1 Tax=Desulfosporosinus meridiei (strain ATCC BAA-275 / DSM 13257 / KCTC 12902 / NCIMB 13706 / S10) TaxID=768704 RepID=J7J4M9_DESMD|nr:hypothetical protein [Desulfosporosinus meridiei]AFQ46238.1 hypothetical protein Desmer_4432 [Desulfosporosinus meridiei DSM 13257]
MSFSLEEKREILGKEITEIYERYLLSNNAYCFSQQANMESINKYDQFKSDVAKLLDVHKSNVHIFGSGKLGFSLNPVKNLKDFDDKSDIDIAIISDTHYRMFREAYIKGFYNNKYKYNKHWKVTSAIFRRFIIFDGFTEKNEEYIKWIEKTGSFKSDIQIHYELGNDINYRIFKSWDAVKSYYEKSIKECKEKIN